MFFFSLTFFIIIDIETIYKCLIEKSLREETFINPTALVDQNFCNLSTKVYRSPRRRDVQEKGELYEAVGGVGSFGWINGWCQA